MRYLISLSLILIFAVSAQARDLSLEINDHSVQADYIQLLQQRGYSRGYVQARILYTEKQDATLIGVAAGMKGEPGNLRGVKLGVALTLNGAQAVNDQEVLAAGIGLNARYLPAQLPGLGISAHVTYSPDILTMLDSKDYLEWGSDIGYQLFPNARLYLAYQWIECDFKVGAEQRLDDNFRLGVQFNF